MSPLRPAALPPGRLARALTAVLAPASALATALALALAVATPGPLVAEDGALLAARRNGPIVIDGRLDEPDWSAAVPTAPFRQWDPRRGEPATQRSEARVLYDAEHLYVAARLERTTDAPLVALLHRRDEWSESDQVRVWLDTAGDGRSALIFGVNAANVQRDVLVVEGAEWRADETWSALWESAVARHPGGWSVEWRIPLAALRIRDAGGEQRWGIYFDRFDQAANEVSGSIVTARGTAFLAQLTPLVGLRDLAPPRRLTVVPFVGAGARLGNATAGDQRAGEGSAGLDLALGLTAGSVLDVALRPDFGQVESDPAVLNLSTLETFLPEKRPFFREGTDVLQVPGTTLFHSRRIGSALGPASLAAGERLLAQPAAAPLLGAAKLSGALGDTVQGAVLLARTERARAHVRDVRGEEERRLLAPAATYAAARLERTLGRAAVGGFASLVDGEEVGASGGRRAAVGALDALWKSADRSLTLTGVAAGSSAGPRGAEHDGTYLQLTGTKGWGGGWESYALWRDVSRRFDPNDAGYLERPDERRVEARVTRSWDQTAGVFRNWAARLAGADAADQAGEPFERWLAVATSTGFTSSWWLELELGHNFPHRDDQELRTFDAAEKLYLPRPSHFTLSGTLASPLSRRWSGRLLFGGTDAARGHTHWLELEQTLRLSDRLLLTGASRYRDEPGDLRWLATPATAAGETTPPIVGERALRQLDQSLRLSYAPSTTLSFELYTQWLSARWEYDALARFVDGRVEPGLPAQTAAPTTRFGRTDWRINAVARWELRPGSTLSLVYSRGALEERWRNGLLRTGLLDELPADEALQAKLAWRFG